MSFTIKTGVAIVAAAVAFSVQAQELTGTLKKIKETGAITLGVRESSIPFSYLDDKQQPIGYAMDLCMKVVDAVKAELKMPNLKVNLQPVTSGNRIPQLQAGNIDMECGSTTNSVERQKQVAFGPTYFVINVTAAVKKSSGIKSLADLKGKTIGISVIGGGTQGPFELLLKKNGVDPKTDIKLVETGFSISEDALRQGRVDAVNMNQPFAARAEAKGGTRKLFSLSEEMPNIVHILEACRADFVDKNPELVKAYVRDITLGMKKALADRAETLKVVSEQLKAPIPVLDTYLLKDNDFGRDPGAAPNFEAIQKMLDIYAATGMLPKLDVTQFKHPSIVAPLQ